MFSAEKGFVLTISVLMIVLFAFLFSQAFSQSSFRQDAVFSQSSSLEKSAFLADNVSFEAAGFLGTRVFSESDSSNSIIHISDSFSRPLRSKLAELKDFAENDFAKANNASVSLDVSGLSDGTAELYFENLAEYDFSYEEPERVDFYSIQPSAEFSRIDLNIQSAGALSDVNAWQWNPEGDLELNLYYKDSAVTVKTSGRLDSSVENLYVFNYAAGSLRVSVGSFGGKENALRIEKDSGVDDLIPFSLSAFYPLQESLEYYYNGEASVEQLSSQKTSRLVPLALEK